MPSMNSALKWLGWLSVVAMLLARAEASPSAPQVGDTYEIIMKRVSEQHSSNGSSGSSNDNNAIVERVVGVRPDGLELEYDLPAEVTAQERATVWQFPARIFKPNSGAMQLLNAPELEARVDSWLKTGGMSRSACGHWIFTWNAFRIECDPQSVIKEVEAFDLPTGLRDGGSYRDNDASAPGTLTKKGAAPDGGATFTADMPVDADAVHHARAEQAVAVGEIMNKPVTLDAALQEQARETISGTISATFDTDAAGNVRRQTKVIQINIKLPDGQSETDTTTETLERQLISHH